MPRVDVILNRDLAVGATVQRFSKMADNLFRASEDSFAYEEFFNAASEGELSRLEAALLPSLNVNALEADPFQGRSALHMAAQIGSVPATQFLLAHGAKVDLRNSEGETPLHEAAFSAHPEAIKALLDAEADINLPTGDYNYTALHNVLKYKNTVTPQQIETIMLLLDRGLDVNAEADDWGSTLIDQACGLHCTELAQLLIDRGARFDNALRCAVNDYATVEFLLRHGAKVVSAPGKSSAITSAAGTGNAEVVQLLVSHANDAELDGSRDALNWAAASGRMDAAKVLIKHGFDVNAITKDCFVGETPLLAACELKRVNPQRMAVAELLIENGADVNARNPDGKTAAELLVQNDFNGLFRKNAELQQLLSGTDTR